MASSESPSQLSIHNGREDTERQEQPSSSRGGWSAAIFIIRKQTFSFSYNYSIQATVFHFGNLFSCCSCWGGREIFLLWHGWKPHHVPHKWTPWAHPQGCKECQHLGWSFISPPNNWGLRRRCLSRSIQHHSHLIDHLLLCTYCQSMTTNIEWLYY